MVGKPAAGKRRNVIVLLRAMPDERRRWERAAKQAGVSLSAWIRNLANGATAPRRAP